MKILAFILGFTVLATACGDELLVTGGAAKKSTRKLERLTPPVVQAGSVVLVHGDGITRNLQARIGGVDVGLRAIDKRRAKIILPPDLPDGLVKVDFSWADGTEESLNIVQGPPSLQLVPSSLPSSSICKGIFYKTKNGLILEGEQDCGEAQPVEVQGSCTEDGQVHCLATATFPAVDKLHELEQNKDLIHHSLHPAGISATMGDCNANDSACYVPDFALLSQPKKAYDANAFLPGLIKEGTVLAGVTGTLKPRPSDCAAESATACVAVANFPAAKKSAIDATGFPSSLSILSVSGNMSDCTANGSHCYVPTYANGSQSLKAIDASPITADVIKQGSTLAGINGILAIPPANCTADGQTACVGVAAYPSTVKAALTPNKMLSGLTLGGVSGTQQDCSADAAVGCRSVAGFPAVQKSLIVAANFHQDFSLAGIQGTLDDCLGDGSHCYLAPYAAGTQPLKAIDYDGITANIIKQASTVAGIAGTVVEKPADCATDGGTNCVTTVNFPSLDKASLTAGAAKLSSSLSFAGVVGLLDDCTADGQFPCRSTANYPSMDKAAAVASKIHSSLTLGGVAGTMNDCGSDGGTSCFTVGNYPSIDKLNLDTNKAKIRSNLAVVGITGTLGDCAANGSDCYLPAYASGSQALKAIDFDGISAGIIKVGSSVAGINGTMVESPANCSADAQTNCVAVASFPAMDKLTVDANKSKLHTSLTAGGVTGTFADCNADGASGCYAVSTFPATNQTNLDSNKSKIRSTLTLGGVTGTMGACVGNGSDCFLGSYALVTQPLKAIDFSGINANIIKDSVVIAGIAGTVVESGPNCSSDGQQSCVATSTYPAMDKTNVDSNKAKMHTSITAGSVTGTLPDCNSDGGLSCFAVADFPAVAIATMNAQKAKVSDSIQIGAVAGTMATCSANSSNCMLPPYVAATQPLKAIDFDGITAPIIKSGSTIAGIAGSLVERPVDCTSDGDINCATVANFPAMNFNSVNTNKAKILPTLTAGGVTGTLADCSTDAGTDCHAVSAYRAFDKTTANSNLAKIRSSLTFAGLTGTAGDCGANGSTCYLPAFSGGQRSKAIDFDSITPGLVKKNTVIAGVTGDYPSSTYPLNTGDAYSDLVSVTFNSQISNATTVGWFDRNGTRITSPGDANIDVENIKSGVNIFGVNGSLTTLDPWDVRAGTSFGTASTGKLKINCRNLTDITGTWDISQPKAATVTDSTNIMNAAAHGLSDGQRVRVGFSSTTLFNASDQTDWYVISSTPNTFKLSATSGGAEVDLTPDQVSGVTYFRALDGVNSVYDTVDAINGGSSAQPTGNPWGSANYACYGVETVAGDSNVWKDVTSGVCDSAGDECRYMDKITKLEWSESIGTGTWAQAVAMCEALVFDGKSDWRLPTQIDAMSAAEHGMFSAVNANWLTAAQLNSQWFWTDTRLSQNLFYSFVGALGNESSGGSLLSTASNLVACVRND